MYKIMSLRFALVCLTLLVLTFVSTPTSAAPLEAALVQGSLVPDLDVTPSTPVSESSKPKQRTFFLLLPLLFPDQFY